MKYKNYICVDEKWVKTIPSHWGSARLKRILQERKERNNPIKSNYILSLTANQGVVPISEKQGAGGNKPKEDITLYNIARADDLLINCMNVVSGAAGVSRWNGVISPVYYALFPRDAESCNIWYYHYIFRLLTFQRSLFGLGKGILMHESSTGKINTVRMRISMDYLNNVILPIPPREEQNKIVQYLNCQVSKISNLIAIKKSETILLKEYKESSISFYIINGISKESLRNTEIFWLKQTPVSWNETKLKNLLVKQSRQVLAGADLLICSNSGKVKIRGDSRVGLVATSDEVYQGVKKGDLLIHGMDTWHGAIAISEFDGMCTPVVHVCTCTQSKRFIAYYLKMMAYTKVFKAISNGVRQNTSDFRSWEKFGSISISFPTIDEQEQISDFLDQVIEATDILIEKLNSQIEVLHEMRTRLISDVITGQIDVRDVVVPDFEYTEVPPEEPIVDGEELEEDDPLDEGDD